MGITGPDKGKGGKYLLLPPGYDGDVPDGYHLVRSQTYNLWIPWRSFLVDGDPKPGTWEAPSALGQKRTSASRSGMSALPLKADMLGVGMNVCLVPLADITAAPPGKGEPHGSVSQGARNLNGSAGLNCPDTSPPTFDGTPSLSVIGFAPALRSTLSRSTQITDGLITESK